MTKLEELIKEFCPNGVRFVALEEVCDFNRGTPITSKDAVPGEVPVISGGQKPAFYHNVANRKANSITIAGSGAYAGFISYWLEPIFCADSFTVDVKDENILNKRYLYHFLLNKQEYIYGRKQGAGIPHVHGKDIARLQIPLPPLAVQREVVRILDKFTLLSQELAAELAARRVQYEHYRDRLVSFNKEIKKVKLQDIATEIYRGSGITREQVTEEGIPCVRYGEIYTSYNVWFDKCLSHTTLEDIQTPKYFEYGDILFAITGESVEDIAKSIAYVGHEKCLAGGDIVVMKHKQNPKYLAYALSTYDARQQKSKGKIKSKVVHSNVPSILNIEIPLPPLEVQERIVKVLDNFDAICSDLGIGLPAEIEKRQQQYEYYRDKLLTFDMTSATIFTDRQTDRQTGLIKLLQYVYGYAFVRLGDIANIKTGQKPNNIVEEGLFEYINAGTTKSGFVESYNCEGDIVTTPSRGQGGIGFIGYQKNRFWLGPLCYGIKSKNSRRVLNKFLYYILNANSSQIMSIKKSGGVPAINSGDLAMLVIPLPPINEQERIVEILDRFDKLCNDLSEGLPAEIDARQKQYEYYRDKLLRF